MNQDQSPSPVRTDTAHADGDHADHGAQHRAAPHGRRRLYRGIWLAWSLVNLAAFGAALTLPLVEVRQLFVFRDRIVLANVPWTLAENHEIFLAVVVFVFGIVVPLAKALAACVAPARYRGARPVNRRATGPGLD